MKLIADSGGTKVEWALVDAGKVVKQIFTSGINTLILTEEEISQYIDDELILQLGDLARNVTEVYFYGAGCVDDDVCRTVRRAIRANIPVDAVEAHSDLLGAARAIFGRESGIACILGTGANSGYYNGTLIKDHISPLGYILGDEGSGAVLGRHLIGDVLKHQLPRELCDRFLDEYNLDSAAILRRVYKEPMPNRFLAKRDAVPAEKHRGAGNTPSRAQRVQVVFRAQCRPVRQLPQPAGRIRWLNRFPLPQRA